MIGNPAARWDAFWWIAGIVLVLVTSLSLSWCYWEELRGDQESLSTTVRNVGLVIGGVIAILFAVWRSIVAEKQAKTAQRGLLNERYQKGAEMLGSDVLAVRLGGIYALARLARERAEDYHMQAMSLLCACVRHPVADEAADPIKDGSLTIAPTFKTGRNKRHFERPLRVREDVQAVMTAVHERSGPQIKIEEIEKGEDYGLNLSGANLADAYLVNMGLPNADLTGVNLTGADLLIANLYRANLTGANLTGANLSLANLFEANLEDANLEGVNLNRANLNRANLTAADLRNCEGLIQKQIDQARAVEGNPPNLTDVVDAETGDPLVWRGGVLIEPW